jgi:hypothetical protein
MALGTKIRRRDGKEGKEGKLKRENEKGGREKETNK